MTYLAIDLEMTGLKVKTDRILEIGALRMENGSPAGDCSALINPHCVIPADITQLTADTGFEPEISFEEGIQRLWKQIQRK